MSLILPKFKFSFNASWKNFLINLGLKDIFTDHANLSGINQDENLYVSDIFQKAFIEVNEEGTEAAAATAIIVGVTSAPV